MFRKSPVVVLVGLALSLAAGCNKSPHFDVAPVEGTVTLDGRPLTSGKVTFVPDQSQGTDGPIGVGEIQPDGRYKITTLPRAESLDGAIVGHHRIRVSHFASDRKPETRDAVRMYGSEKTSGLTADVEADQKNKVDLPLTSQPKS